MTITTTTHAGGSAIGGTGTTTLVANNMTATAVSALPNMGTALDALSTSDKLMVLDVSDPTEGVSGTLKDIPFDLVAQFWHLPVTPQMFGAKGDHEPTVILASAATDDRAAMQAAIDHVVTNGGVLWLGNKHYRCDVSGGVGLVVGNGTVGSAKTFSIIGANSSAAARGTSITITGDATHGFLMNTGVYRNFMIGGFDLRFKKTLAEHVYYVPANDSEFGVTNGISYVNSYFSGGKFFNMIVRNAKKAIALLGESYNGNGEFVSYDRVFYDGGCQRFFYLANGTGQSFGHKFRNCGGSSYYKSFTTTGFIAFEIGGGGGHSIEIQSFDSTCIPDESVSGLAGTDLLPRTTFLKAAGGSGPVYCLGGRNEGYTTIYWNAGGGPGLCVKLMSMDWAGMYSSDTNPTVIDSSNAYGSFVIEDSSLPIMNAPAEQPYRNNAKIVIAGHQYGKGSYSFVRTAISDYNSPMNRTQGFKVTYGASRMSKISFQDCQYFPDSDWPQARLINAVYQGSVPHLGEMVPDAQQV